MNISRSLSQKISELLDVAIAQFHISRLLYFEMNTDLLYISVSLSVFFSIEVAHLVRLYCTNPHSSIAISGLILAVLAIFFIQNLMLCFHLIFVMLITFLRVCVISILSLIINNHTRAKFEMLPVTCIIIR